MRSMGLRYHGASSSERRGRVSTQHREGERKVACPEDRDRSDRYQHSPEVRPWSHGGGGGSIDSGFEVAAVADHLGEESQLIRSPGKFSVEFPCGETGFKLGCLDELLAVLLYRVGHGVE